MASNRGRPLSFDRQTALKAATDLFWRRGYAASSLDDLLAATGLARSSFYAAFGSKHAVMLEALDLYTTELLGRMRAAAHAFSDPRPALRRVVDIIACTEQPDAGCLFVNMCAERLPHDPAVAQSAREYLESVDRLVKDLLAKIDSPGHALKTRSGAILALATGAVTLRKAGETPAKIRAMLDGISLLIA